VPHGTTTVFVDPHELVNVVGPAGVRYVLEASRELPLEVFVMVPSCVPASPFDDPGGTMTTAEIVDALRHERVLGLAEMMNFPGAIFGDPGVLEKLAAGADRPIDGHAPGVSGKPLNAYLLAGPESDHETTQWGEAREKVRRGMVVFIREGSASQDLEALLPAVTPANSRRFGFACDDIHPTELLAEGHVDRILRKAMGLGLDPLTAVQMATLNLAERFCLRRHGVLAPGRWADFIVVPDLAEMRVAQVYKRGQLVAEDGVARFDAPPVDQACLRDTVHLPELSVADLALSAPTGSLRAIEVLPTHILTRDVTVEPKVEGGYVVSDPARDLLKGAAIERHRGTGLRAVGLIRGFGLQRGALASSMGHDSHNLTVVGVADADLLAAVRAVAEMGGGMAVAENGRVIARLALPLAGLMSDRPAAEVAAGVEQVQQAAQSLGCVLPHPLMTLSFISLAVIPELRLTPRGVVDVGKFELIG
jgi:adenine deaminase